MKFEVKKGEVWSSIGALKQLLEEKAVKRCSYIFIYFKSLCLPEGKIRRPYLMLEDEVRKEILESIDDDDAIPHDSVVLGLAPSLFNYENLNTAFRILTRASQVSSSPPEKPPFMVTHTAKYLRDPDGLLSLSLGPFVATLESASGVEALTIGKPARRFFEGAISTFQLDSEGDGMGGRIVTIGDDIVGDLGEGAVELGLWRVLGRSLLPSSFFFRLINHYLLHFDNSEDRQISTR